MAGRAQRPEAQRTCVACRTTRAKRELVRVVRGPSGGLAVDLRGKSPGRGAYLCADASCLDRGLAGGTLGAALGVAIGSNDADRLRRELNDAKNVRVGS